MRRNGGENMLFQNESESWFDWNPEGEAGKSDAGLACSVSVRRQTQAVPLLAC